MRIEVNRSVLRYWVAGLLAIPLILLAIEISFAHRLFGEPERDDDGRLTNQGLSETRADWIWAAGLAIAGVGLATWSFRELGAPRQVLVAEDEGLFLAVGSTRRPEVFVPWHQVDSLRSTVADDDAGPRPVLELDLTQRAWVPAEPVGARWHGRLLEIDAGTWRPAVHEVAGVLQMMLERSQVRGQAVTLLDPVVMEREGGEAVADLGLPTDGAGAEPEPEAQPADPTRPHSEDPPAPGED